MYTIKYHQKHVQWYHLQLTVINSPSCNCKIGIIGVWEVIGQCKNGDSFPLSMSYLLTSSSYPTQQVWMNSMQQNNEHEHVISYFLRTQPTIKRKKWHMIDVALWSSTWLKFGGIKWTNDLNEWIKCSSSHLHFFPSIIMSKRNQRIIWKFNDWYWLYDWRF